MLPKIRSKIICVFVCVCVCVWLGMWQLCGRREIDIRVSWENLIIRHNLEELSLDGKIILEGY